MAHSNCGSLSCVSSSNKEFENVDFCGRRIVPTKLSEQEREQTTNSTHISRQLRDYHVKFSEFFGDF